MTSPPYPGSSVGLPRTGPGSLASWSARISALVIDWAASMLVAMGLFGMGVFTGGGWRAWMTLAVYVVQKAVLTALTGGSFGQLVTRVGVVRLDRRPLGVWRPLVRTLLIAVVLPTLVVGPERRALDDVLLGTVVVNRR